MSTGIERPVAFYHSDGLVAAWNFASKYAGQDGHVATLPELIELRCGAKEGSKDSPWNNWYTSASAEYVGIGADGRIKIIVAHGVGPMSNIDGIKAAYKWEWGDKSRNKRGGRITARKFLDLEAGKYGTVKVIGAFDLRTPDGHAILKFDIADVNVLDFQDYLDSQNDSVFWRYLTAHDALRDPLMRMRLGSSAFRYLMNHMRIAKALHSTERPNDEYAWSKGFDDRDYPYVTEVKAPSNCPYTQPNEAIRQATRRWVDEPRVPEEGYALAHLLSIDQLMQTHTQEVGVMFSTSPDVHEWWNGAKFVAVPSGTSLDKGLATGPDPARTVREHWVHFMQPVEEGYTPITPFLLKCVQSEWFACYPKKLPDEQCMDDGDLEFHVRSVERIGKDGIFTSDEMFFLRYSLSQIKTIMPREANAYEIIDISPRSGGITTVMVRFYRADVDTTRRLPRTEVIARDYDRLMEAYVH